LPAHGEVGAAQRSDAALLEQARGGDAAAFAVANDGHASAAYSLAYRRVHGAQDVVQESFLALWRTDNYRADQGSLRNFVFGIVRNRAIAARRRDGRRRTEERCDEAAVSNLSARDRTDVEVEQREAQRLLRIALVSLPQAQHRALELAFFEGLTHAEIALRLNAPIGTIKGRIRLRLKKLRAEIATAATDDRGGHAGTGSACNANAVPGGRVVHDEFGPQPPAWPQALLNGTRPRGRAAPCSGRRPVAPAHACA
jgi:RNA polymerase sigma-70 factor, ECF subfamily